MESACCILRFHCDNIPILSRPRKPPENTFFPEGSLRLTHLIIVKQNNQKQTQYKPYQFVSGTPKQTQLGPTNLEGT